MEPKIQIGDLVEFIHGSVGVPKGSLGLVVDKEIIETMEAGRWNYFIFKIKTFDGRERKFSDSYIKKVNPNLYST
tara:strand:+ start:827 stop:1051 length:225 start_codon:yes stop_codon:yes gene_type:complete